MDGTSIIYAHQNTAGNFLVYTRACLCTLYFVEVFFINRFLTLKGFTCEILSRTSNDNLCDKTGFSRIKSNDAVLCTTVFTLADPEFFSPFPFERQIDSHCFFTRRPSVYKTKQHRTIHSFILFTTLINICLIVYFVGSQKSFDFFFYHVDGWWGARTCRNINAARRCQISCVVV